MAITNAQQAKQIMNEGGPMRKIKGQDHMLAYITPGERDTLVDLGGQETMTPEGILAYPPSNYAPSSPSKSSTTNNSNDYTGSDYGFVVSQPTTTTTTSSGNNNDGGSGYDPGFQEALRKQKIEEKKKKARDDGGFRTTGSQVYSPPTFFQSLKNKSYQSAIDRNKYAALQKTSLIPGGGFKGFTGSIIDGIFGKVPENLQDLSEEELTKLAFEVQKFKDAGGTTNQATYNYNLNPTKKGSGLELLGRTFDAQDLLDSGKMTQSKYEELFPKRTLPTSGDGSQDPCKGPNPPAYCFVGNNINTTEEQVVPTRNLGGLAPRFAGSIFNFDGMADGGRAGFKDGEGIMQMASSPDPMDERNMVMETIAMEEFGKPLSDLSEDEIIQIELFMEEMSKRKNEPRVMAQQGGRMMNDDDPTGGIMDLESGRQMYFLGKLVKKATRAVKKIVKSPIGKAALIGGLGYLGATKMGGMKGIMNSLFGTPFVKGVPPGIGGGESMGLLAKLGLTKGSGQMALTGLGKGALYAGVPAIASYFMTPKEEEDDNNDDYYKANRLNIADIRNRPYDFLAPRIAGSRFNVADGGRIDYAEGSEEPVAKKTMPLLDMDGQEMDLREEGGFVPLGRMERADDVPARLSKNEFVFTADAVRNAGEGDVDKGAEVMYNMMKNLESGGDVSEESQGLEGAREMFQTSQRLEEVI